MAKVEKLTYSTMAVLASLCRAKEPIYGLEIIREMELQPGVVYPILSRLLDRGVVTAKKERDPNRGRPPRIYYQLTALGRREAWRVLEKLQIR